MKGQARMLPLARIQAVIGRGFRVTRDAQEAAEGVERVEAPVKAERELIEVSLQMLRAYAVVRPGKPAFQVRENEVRLMRLIRNSDGKELRCGDLVCILATDETFRLFGIYVPDEEYILGSVSLNRLGTLSMTRHVYPTAIGARFV